MCGIAGQVKGHEPVEVKELQRMSQTLSHRGPDAAGLYLNDSNTVGLVHRRLSILDLGPGGAQPMQKLKGQVTLIFNGMVSNFKQLRQSLISDGFRFEGQSDTEVVIQAYIRWGIDFLKKLRGMFALAIWDARYGKLILARDHFGIKPLYFTSNEQGFYFASELKAFSEINALSCKLSLEGARDFLFYRYVPLDRTIWQGVHKVLPGECIVVSNVASSAPPDIRKHFYWSITHDDQRMPAADLANSVTGILEQSVLNNMSSDVPVGLFLSGGYDSSAIACLLRRNGVDLATFSIGFEGWAKSEHISASQTAQILQTDHHEQILDASDPDVFGIATAVYDDPFGGTSLWPTTALCHSARQNIKVALGGDGGDEIFAGYNWYPSSNDSCSRARTLAMNNYVSAMNWGRMSGGEVAQVLGLKKEEAAEPGDLFRDMVDWSGGTLKAFQAIDFQTFLPDVVLAKIDRAAMSVGLEVRVPFLDTDLVDLVFSLDPGQYFRAEEPKFLLRQLMPSQLGKLIASRPKQGFGAPVGAFMKIERIEKELINSDAVRDGFFNERTVKSLASQNRFHALFALNMLSAWYGRWGSVL